MINLNIDVDLLYIFVCMSECAIEVQLYLQNHVGGYIKGVAQSNVILKVSLSNIYKNQGGDNDSSVQKTRRVFLSRPIRIIF